MKIATMIAAASLAAMACAEEPAAKTADSAAKPAASPAGERAPARRAARPMRSPGVAQDPLVRAAMNPRIAEKIGLTAEQKAKLGDASELRAKSRALQEKVRKAMERQMELLHAEKIDEAAVMAAIDEAFEARKEVAKEQTRRLILVRTVLTPEQVKAIREEMASLRKGGEGRGPKPGHGDRAEPPPPPPKGEPPEDAPEDGPKGCPGGCPKDAASAGK